MSADNTNSANTEEKVSIYRPRPIQPVDFSDWFQREFKANNVAFAFYEIVEGTSIYAYYKEGYWELLNCDKYIDDDLWEHRVKSFKDACDALNVDLDRDLDQNFTYSFVFRTPDNEYVNSSLNSYEIYIVGVYSVNKNNDVPFNLSDVTAYKCRGEQPCYKNNRTILIPHKVKVQLDNLSLIVKEWGVGDGLPNIILNDDDYDRRAFIHDCSEKGITMVHVPTGTTSHVLNRYYLNYIKKQQKQDTN
jgi:hypothetical protein